MDVTMIAPVLGSASHIETCVINAAKQNIANLKHIILDGGSTDGTLDLLDRLTKSHTHVRGLGGPDKGQFDAMNKVIRIANGRILGILSADDFYESNAVGETLDRLKYQSSPNLVASNCRIVDESGVTLEWNKRKRLDLGALLLGWLNHQFPANPCAYLYRREVHETVRLYDVDEHFGMDLKLLLKCAANKRMIYVDRHGGKFKLWPGYKTYSNTKTPNTIGWQIGTVDRHVRMLPFARRMSIRFSRVVRKDIKTGSNRYFRIANCKRFGQKAIR